MLGFRKRIGAKHGVKTIANVIELFAWTHSASLEDLITAVSYGPSVIEGEEVASRVDSLVFARMGEIDGEGAQALIYALLQGRHVDRSAKRALFTSWVENDPTAAIDGESPNFIRVVKTCTTLFWTSPSRCKSITPAWLRILRQNWLDRIGNQSRNWDSRCERN